ncbi:MAG: response regulator [Anaerolineae bacterium]|jgi:CheY-like chemotaxis protein
MEDIPKLLLVDDEPLVRRSMEKTLFRAGFDVETAANCIEGLETFKEAQDSDAPFDLAVLDLNMPGFEGTEQSGAGLELLSRLIKLRSDLPVVVLTAYDEITKAKEALNRGARSYFVKGREQGLIDLINDILGL